MLIHAMMTEMVISMGYFFASAACTAVVLYMLKWIFTRREDDTSQTD